MVDVWPSPFKLFDGDASCQKDVFRQEPPSQKQQECCKACNRNVARYIWVCNCPKKKMCLCRI